MGNIDIELVKNIINIVGGVVSIVGGVGGLIYLVYFLKDKFRKKEVNLHYISGSYEIENSKSDGYNINAIVEVAIRNDTDESISLTDLLGTIKYNKQKYAQNVELLLKATKDTKDIKTERPSNYREVTHFTISPRASIQKTLTFKFLDVIPNLIDRRLLPRLVGVLSGDLPIIAIDEREVLKDWEKYPLNLLLSAHINEKKLIQKQCPLYKKTSLNDENFSGSLNLYEQVQIENGFRNAEGVPYVEPTKTKIKFN